MIFSALLTLFVIKNESKCSSLDQKVSFAMTRNTISSSVM